MFLTNKVIPYPSKTVVKDVLTRSGAPNEYSFTPYEGMSDLIVQQFHSAARELDINALINYIPELDVDKLRANDDGVSRDYGYADVSDYYDTLESIDEGFVKQYITNSLIGYKLNKDGIRAYKKDLLEDIRFFKDEENETTVSESDLVEKDKDYTIDDILDAKRKLPYLLKVLHQGSIIMKGSILSFIIAVEKCTKNKGWVIGYVPKPSEIVAQGVYKMNVKGNCTGKFTIEENTCDPLRSLIALVTKPDKKDMYYKTYQDLMRVLDVLDIDITKQNALDYQNDYIEKIVCTYLASNEEYLETYGLADRNILKLIAPDKLFSVASKINKDDELDNAFTSAGTIAESIDTNFMSYLCRNGIYEEKRRDVQRLIEIVSNKTKRLSNYVVDKCLLKKRDGSFVRIRIGSQYAGIGFSTAEAVISITGHLILLKESDDTLEIVDIFRVIEGFSGGENAGPYWRTITV